MMLTLFLIFGALVSINIAISSAKREEYFTAIFWGIGAAVHGLVLL